MYKDKWAYTQSMGPKSTLGSSLASLAQSSWSLLSNALGGLDCITMVADGSHEQAMITCVSTWFFLHKDSFVPRDSSVHHWRRISSSLRHVLCASFCLLYCMLFCGSLYGILYVWSQFFVYYCVCVCNKGIWGWLVFTVKACGIIIFFRCMISKRAFGLEVMLCYGIRTLQDRILMEIFIILFLI